MTKKILAKLDRVIALLEDLFIHEAADFLGTTTNTVNVSLYKAKKKAGKK